MSSRFVSAGGAEISAPEGLSSATDDAWTKAKEQVEKAKQPAKNEPAPGTQEGGKSLYEHLQDQRAAKQEAFEEASKLKNQFRPLDDAEVEFLEGIKQKELSASANVRKETAEQLEAFRRERAAAELLAQEQQKLVEPSEESTEQWATAKKRRRAPAEDQAASTKARKVSSTNDSKKPDPSEIVTKAGNTTDKASASTAAPGTTPTASATQASAANKKQQSAPSLVTYDSDSDG